MNRDIPQEPVTDQSDPKPLIASPWTLEYADWNPRQQPLRESLCTLGNGHFATRGAAEEAAAGGPHYPGTYLAGGYNRLESEVAGRLVPNEDLVNWPNWLSLSFRHAEGEWFDLAQVDILSFHQVLELREGVLRRTVQFRDAEGRESTLTSRRLVHMTFENVAAMQWTLTPENWSGPIDIRSALDGTVINDGVARYRDLESRHLRPLEQGRVAEDGIYLAVETVQSHLRMGQAARTRLDVDGRRPATERSTEERPGWIGQTLSCQCEEKRPLRVEKVVTVYTSHDRAMCEPLEQACRQLARLPGFDELRHSHALRWSHFWKRADLDLGSEHVAQGILRLHIFHLLQTVSVSTIDRDVGVPSRGLHGEAYRGHIFWDELFIFPYLNLRLPELTRALLMYRYRRLPEARVAAREAGYQGAMYPWQSGSDGREESQVVHLNPKSGRWVPDQTYRQRHVNSAIAYNVWQYYQATGDCEFLGFYGAEMILEIARFWASLAEYNADRDRFEIHGVVGPDEFHTQYPGRDEPGLRNNAYTNVLASWVLDCAGKVLDLLSDERRCELTEELGLADEDFVRWKQVAERMYVPIGEDGIISQFEGYERLEEFDWKGYRQKYGDIQRLDRILEAEGDDVNRYKAGKQADVLMLFYLFSAGELQEDFSRMGYEFRREWIAKNIDYYNHRTSHGSTLSHVVHSWVLARSDRERSWQLFEQALESDVADIQGGTTSEGIHLGAMAGTVDLIQRCYLGIEMRDDALWINPCLPDPLGDIHFQMRYRRHWIAVELTSQRLRLTIGRSRNEPVKIGFDGKVCQAEQGEVLEFPLHRRCLGGVG